MIFLNRHTILFPVKKLALRCAVLLAIMALAPAVYPCNVPVFRYGLELWQQDPYRVIIFYQNSLDRSQIAKVKKVASGARSIAGDTAAIGTYLPIKNTTNYTLQLINIKDSLNFQTRKFSGMPTNPLFPFCTVLFPERAMNAEPIYSGPLNETPFEALFDSPARRAIAAALSKGMSGIWLFIGSGAGYRDSAATRTLAAAILECKKTLRLPDSSTKDIKEVVQMSDIPLRIDFSVIPVSRADPRERYFIGLLEKTQPQLKLLKNQPLAFSIFARGRVLYALAGKGINPKNIIEAGSFLCGPCACTIKDQNPGTDILMSFDWNGTLSGQNGNSEIIQAALPSVCAMVTGKPAASRRPGISAPLRSTPKDSFDPPAADTLPHGVLVRTEAAPMQKKLTSGILTKSLLIPCLAFVILMGVVLGLISFSILVKKRKKQ